MSADLLAAVLVDALAEAGLLRRGDVGRAAAVIREELAGRAASGDVRLGAAARADRGASLPWPPRRWGPHRRW
jgi:hypothetical protein